MNIFEDLQWRGLVSDCTDTEALRLRLAAGAVTLYCGFDPTADSLHVGSLVPLITLRRFQDAGHIPIAVAGGATGSIGDPSGKTAERQLLTKENIAANVAGVRPQLARLLDFTASPNTARLVDNADWTDGISFIGFLRDIGKHFTVNQMVAKESVRARMEDREVGISYTEFSYMLLQAFDFYVLCRDQGCDLQIGGSDQWGNITAGIDLIRKKLGKPAFGLTLPLITKADGTKFGKTESGTVWLDPRRTSVYRFYQFWVNADDRDVIRHLQFFTFLGREEIESLEEQLDGGAVEEEVDLSTLDGEGLAVEAQREAIGGVVAHVADAEGAALEFAVATADHEAALGDPLHDVVAFQCRGQCDRGDGAAARVFGGVHAERMARLLAQVSHPGVRQVGHLGVTRPARLDGFARDVFALYRRGVQ